jgi:hypothetical protein
MCQMDWSLPLDTFYSILGVDYHDYHVQIFKKMTIKHTYIYWSLQAACR